MKNRHKQLGMSYIGVLLILFIVGGLAKVAITIGPAYYDFYTIDRIIASLYRERGGRANNIEEFKNALSNRFQINNIRDKTPDSFGYSMDGAELTIELDYEVRKQLFGNLDLVAHFKKTYSSDEINK